MRVHTYIIVNPVPCGAISRAAFIGMNWLKYVARFRGQRNFEVRQDFEEIRYNIILLYTVIQYTPLLFLIWPKDYVYNILSIRIR